MLQFCTDELRRNDVARHPLLNGIESIEVLGKDQPPGADAQCTLLVRCLKTLPPLTRANVTITGGARVPVVGIVWAARADAVPAADAPLAERTWLGNLADPSRILAIRTATPGDFSRYTLSIVDGAGSSRPAETFDPPLSKSSFSFKVDCPSDFDCEARGDCTIDAATAPDIDYLSKDYASYRRLILDRLSQLLPDWRDRTPADLGVVLAEALAYVGDQLSYEQDAVATEAYLGTARRRVSVRRHARLVDYHLHDGCNARAWVVVDIAVPRAEIKKDEVWFATRLVNVDEGRLDPHHGALGDALAAGLIEVFEPMEDMTLFSAHAELPIYTWGDRNCCLPKGATRATLLGHFPELAAGDIVIFEERLGPRTHDPADADLAHRHAVRLTSAQATADGSPLTDPLYCTEITEIAWHEEDALPFPLCVSSISDPAHGEQYRDRISVARGNVVLLDHGRSMAAGASESLGVVPANPKRYRPRIVSAPITQAPPLPARSAAARHATRTTAGAAVPTIALISEPGSQHWLCRRDLLSSKRHEAHFVLETEDDGTALIRFGDNVNGNRPESGAAFHARYRVGNGAAGNVGAEAIAHAVTMNAAILGVRNPMPASGGVDPQSIEDARRRAPHAFRQQERAVTAADYARVTESYGGVQRASARLRWTGSWHSVFVAVDRDDGAALTDPFEEELRSWVDRYRMAGHDLEFDHARFVPIEIEIQLCVAPGYDKGDVAEAVLTAVDALFDADRLTFGQTVYLSPIYSAVHAVAGVASAEIVTFQRQGTPDRTFLDAGQIEFGALEIPQLDNDPNLPDRGVLRVTVLR